ncbi:MAG: hypothetical protein J0L88_02335 [Xanthomonadales bacterium]|nr:hypothetical protein [Xanthomonadales bacterium]
MNAAVDSLLADLERHRVMIQRRGDRLTMRAPVPPPADLLARVREAKPALLSALPDAGVVTRTVVRFRLAGGHPGSWCAAIGTKPRNEIIADLRAIHGDALVEVLSP